jgi:hypothetical protein
VKSQSKILASAAAFPELIPKNTEKLKKGDSDHVGWPGGSVWSIVLSLAMIYLLTIICGLYPSWLATKVQPATALRHE